MCNVNIQGSNPIDLNSSPLHSSSNTRNRSSSPAPRLVILSNNEILLHFN